ncbi:hypothetical protein TWF569_004781 [Orbilia oligospora]|nr:hypothetical protein TWF569_004781 [Orbilia oligospora]
MEELTSSINQYNLFHPNNNISNIYEEKTKNASTILRWAEQNIQWITILPENFTRAARIYFSNPVEFGPQTLARIRRNATLSWRIPPSWEIFISVVQEFATAFNLEFEAPPAPPGSTALILRPPQALVPVEDIAWTFDFENSSVDSTLVYEEDSSPKRKKLLIDIPSPYTSTLDLDPDSSSIVPPEPDTTLPKPQLKRPGFFKTFGKLAQNLWQGNTGFEDILDSPTLTPRKRRRSPDPEEVSTPQRTWSELYPPSTQQSPLFLLSPSPRPNHPALKRFKLSTKTS